ncbi:MAG: hypothetical protein QXG10_01085 [Candidatus Hadarchaeales archaeon]
MKPEISRVTCYTDVENGVYFYLFNKVKEENISLVMANEVKSFYRTPFKHIWNILSGSWFGGWAIGWQYS